MSQEDKGKKKRLTLLERATADEDKDKQKLIDSLSIRDRLMRRLEKAVVEVEFEDDLGTFIIRCRTLAEKEQRKVMSIQGEVRNIKNPKQYADFMDELFKFVAYPDGICLEKELDMKFWKSGNYAVNDIFKLLASAIEGSTAMIRADTRSFREK